VVSNKRELKHHCATVTTTASYTGSTNSTPDNNQSSQKGFRDCPQPLQVNAIIRPNNLPFLPIYHIFLIQPQQFTRVYRVPSYVYFTILY
jgi:hypothetical protein